MNMRNCCINSCRHNGKNSSCHLHGFPNDPETCNAWVQIIGESKLLTLDTDTLHNKRYLCSCHFVDDDYISPAKMHLKSTAVPTIFLEQTDPICDNDIKPFSSPEIPVPKTSYVASLSNLENSPNVIYLPKISKSTSTDSNSTGKVAKKRIRKSVAVKYTTKKKLMEDAGVLGAEVTDEMSAILDLLADERAKTKNLEAALLKMSQERDMLEVKLTNCQCHKNISKRPGLSLLLDLEQKNLMRKSGGARYTNEEISFLTNIYKLSPKCYRYLSDHIFLPCEKTLKRASRSLESKQE